MIIFDLACGCGCQFEGWFQSHADFLAQQQAHQLACPACGDRRIRKLLSPVASLRSGVESVSEMQTAPVPASSPAGAADADYQRLAAEFVYNLSRFVEKNFEDVGPRLAEETLKMQFGNKAVRNIRGVTTEEEEKLLKSEGIELLKVPIFKDREDERH
jgi:hypothetical protein